MRIVAGLYGGRRLLAPKGDATRPTSDRVREALFSILGPLDGLRVLDLFAGSGALGLEALSRGAAHVTFVDDANAAVRAIEANLEALGVPRERVAVQRRDARAVVRAARAARHEYDLVLLDPPYRLAPELGRELSPALAELIAADGRIVCESDRRAPLGLELPLTDERRYGDTLIRIHEPE
ncbi:16S rRNA (guanine(966)-N(2))-methyltransferase RsmD [Conexibacter woesei]|uniref:Methyltransferase n=1 Tax=Conexibacter woesei (strain DSM 14684 / CCUG 47730 / CIP 108061 / JCM 11494 / NBRC 100937 / ID131577) TaxID=469383 RepID=D3F1F4_CONWI|nr:16S rRNA (guanine(966)-N(2))-methyltransferase RsmD [Conexibacter woesei]ADB52117.1 methyltransferase [Conexibacter woesei DSM 14684]